MATLSASRLYDWIERLWQARRSSSRTVFEIERFRYTAIRRLVEDELISPDEADHNWLERPELRGPEAVIAILGRTDLGHQQGTTRALFVDGRCGLIGSYDVDWQAEADVQRIAPEILKAASNCHAEGIILATNDVKATAERRRKIQNLSAELCRKGEAIDIYLLDHFVLTQRQWERQARPRRGRR